LVSTSPRSATVEQSRAGDVLVVTTTSPCTDGLFGADLAGFIEPVRCGVAGDMPVQLIVHRREQMADLHVITDPPQGLDGAEHFTRRYDRWPSCSPSASPAT
jgi:hypothetical protein